MKKGFYLIAALCTLLGLSSCDKNSTGDGPGSVSPQAQAALAAKYPDAANVRWHFKNGYYVADFQMPVRRSAQTVEEYAAWFDNAGKWYMTETDITFDALPEPVKSSFGESEYASWQRDDVDKLEREGVETVYVIEVEGRPEGIETEVDLYYSPEGILIKKVVDADTDYDYGDYIPSQLPGSIDNFLTDNYPDALLLDIESEDGMTEVEILDGQICRELLFDASGSWICTKTEVLLSSLPETVKQALAGSQYASYRIDDIDHYKSADKEFYRFDLESAAGDVKIDITPAGDISVAVYEPSEPGNGALLNDAVKAMIAAKYPNAVIREFDYDDGLLEVEIYHENKEKDVYFNGSNQWVKTEWDVRQSELPAAVTAAIAASQYSSYLIDDIEYVERPSGNLYRIELERGNSEVTLNIDAQGNIK